MTQGPKPGNYFIVLLACLLLSGARPAGAQTQTKAVPFPYLPEQPADLYYQQIRQHTLRLDENRFIILKRKAAGSYSISLFAADLQKKWETDIPFAENEAPAAFTHNGQSALVLAHRPAAGGAQSLLGTLVDLQTGDKSPAKKIFEAPAGSRRIGTALSPDGTKGVAYYFIYRQNQLHAISATVFDGNLVKIKERTYQLSDLNGIQSAKVHIDNRGNQFVSVITSKATRLAVRRYSNTEAAIQAMDLQVGGVFNGRQVYVFDTFFAVQSDNQVYAAAICADDKTGEYHSLKAVRFDFSTGEMKLVPEFLFTPQYLAGVNQVSPPGSPPAKRLEDISLTDLLLSPAGDLLVVAEKKYQEGPGRPFVAREMHLFAYDSYLNPAWHSLLNKHQTAPANAGFGGISYTGRLLGSHFLVLTLEQHQGKTDLLSRQINLRTGVSSPPVALGLPLSGPPSLPYLKSFTCWLHEKRLVAVYQPAKKGAAPQLARITLNSKQ